MAAGLARACVVLCVLTAGQGLADGMRVGTADTMVKVPRDGVGPLGEEARLAIRWGAALHAELARGELESAQLVIAAPAGHDLGGVRVTVTPPVLGSGRTRAGWPSDCLSLWRVGFVQAFDLWEPHGDLGWLPDPLLPLEGAFDVGAGQYQPVWLRLKATKGMPAGLYRGEVIVEANGMAPVRVPLGVTLWDFTLPATQHFTLSIPTWGGQWEAMYPGTVTPERWRAYLDLLLDYRVSPFPLAEDREIAYCFGRGQREFCLHCFPVDYVPDDTTAKMQPLAAMWSRLPFADEGTPYVLLGDEAPPKYYGNIREQGRLVREAAPTIRRQFTTGPEIATEGFDAVIRGISGAADIAILAAANCYDTDTQTRQLRAGGFDLWWYYVASHYYIPGRGLEARQVFWRHWKYGIAGQLHWGASYWGDANIAGRDGAKWPDIPWDTRSSRTGDGYLVYPAPGGAGMWPSVRLELIRDGVEDYEYFHLLATLTDGAEASGHASPSRIAANRGLLAIDNALVKSYKDYATQPQPYRAYRRELARAIMDSRN